ncbi:MAG TPA: proline/glycine betaine ABC transporter permease [Rubrobacter sp.]|jgi:glycine betaine/proline transport system permease protein
MVALQSIPEIPIAKWVNSAIAWIIGNFGGAFDVLNSVIEGVVNGLSFVLTAPPALVMIVILAVIAFFLSGWRMTIFTVIGLLLVISLGLWSLTMTTLSLILVATTVCLAIGIPIGIVAAKSRRLEEAFLPILDLMQTMPAFVYLVPFVFLLGLGAGPALLATVIFATPPAVRLTMLGIQQVPKETVEAAHAFGATPMQTLFKVELPLSLGSIRAGINQVIMLSLSMVVIAGLVGFEGLGKPVVEGLQSLDVGLAFEGGIGIVVLAIILDRVTRGIGEGGRAKKA